MNKNKKVNPKRYGEAVDRLTDSHDRLNNIDLRHFRGDDQVREAIQKARIATDIALILASERLYG